MTDYASLCFLSYNRPQFIEESIRSAVENAGYPCEVIVHDDGSNPEAHRRTWTRDVLTRLLDEGFISHLILNPSGHNEGVGTAINRMFKIATGDPVIKLDQDLLFNEGWLARVVGILRQDEAVGMLGLFKYYHEPVIWSEQKIEVPTKGGYHYTRQFCGSGFAIPRTVWEELGPLDEHLDAFNEDSEFMAKVRQHTVTTDGTDMCRRQLALPDVDVVSNRGFGIGPSTVVEEGYVVHKIHHEPYVIDFDNAGPVVTPAEKLPPQEAEVISPPVEPAADTHDFEVPMLRRFDVGVVITTCAGREENLKRTLSFLRDLTVARPVGVFVVYDGCSEVDVTEAVGTLAYNGCYIEKHEPGQEQPRNVGFRHVRELWPECNYVWFLDGDIIVPSDTLRHYYEGMCATDKDRILIGPYEWMAPGVTDFAWELKNDPRWVSFDEHGPEKVLRYDLGASLANFGGNLIWPVEEFERIGGFHPDLHHGRCEDGELGLRAGSAGVPMSFVRDARGFHVWHPVDMERTMAANARDVPLLNQIHPWVEGQGLLVTDKDGARFDWRCPTCGEQINSLEYWAHSALHREAA